MRRISTDESGQMLLATGLLLMLALLSMAWYGVSVAGLGEPLDTGSNEVLDTTKTFSLVWEPLLENRTNEMIGNGVDWQSACDSAANSTALDLMRHGEHRGVEIILTDITATNNSGVFTITTEVGIANRDARLYIPSFNATIDLN